MCIRDLATNTYAIAESALWLVTNTDVSLLGAGKDERQVTVLDRTARRGTLNRGSLQTFADDPPSVGEGFF